MTTITFDEILALFGRTIEETEVTQFLSKYPDHRITKPSDGDQDVIFKNLGFDLLFKQVSSTQGRRGARTRPLLCVFLYREGQDRHREFPSLPFHITFQDTRDQLIEKLGQPYRVSDRDEQGRPGWEKWLIEEVTLHTMYDRATMMSKVITVRRACDTTDLP